MQAMQEMWVENYRCFRERQTARLAPLTLLVGDNSTGKTSFLAMTRALHDIAMDGRLPDFKEDPYDLGSFDELAHHRSGAAGRASEFSGGFKGPSRRRSDASTPGFDVVFERDGSAPTPGLIRLALGQAWLCVRFDAAEVHAGVGSRKWMSKLPGHSRSARGLARGERNLRRWHWLALDLLLDGEGLTWRPESKAGVPPSKSDLKRLNEVARELRRGRFARTARPFAAAPVRAKPRRTYDPTRYGRDAQGADVPMLFADLYAREPEHWARLRHALENFGKTAGLFDEINVKALGKRETEPFQLQVRRYSGRTKGPWRNLIDVGYGVSQALPILTELFRDDSPGMFLLQQPEVHLHPSAQAALGTLLCEVAKGGKQLLVETHSDHLINRIRMDVRDGGTGLGPEDVSILYFERGHLDVRVHSIGIDAQGNITCAPDGYGQFFMDETRRSLRL